MYFDPILRAIIDISILIAFAKVLAGVLARFQLPEVLGELFAGIILGPFAFGSLQIGGEPLVVLNEHVQAFGEIGAILILFVAGLEVGFGQFKALRNQSFVIGISGVIIPFLFGLFITLAIPLPPTDLPGALVVAAALTATSIAITMRTLEELGALNSTEGRLMINAAVIDDVLGLIVLSIVVSIITTGVTPSPVGAIWVILRTLGLWLALLVSVVYVGSRLLTYSRKWSVSGTIEVAATALCFGSAVLSAAIGLHPIVGAFSAGMAIAESRVLAQVREYISKVTLIFSPIFFAVIGARLNLWSLGLMSIYGMLLMLAIAIATKVIGCGIPAILVTRNRRSGMSVGVGMISRGEVGLIVAGIGLTTGAITQDVYAQIVAMAIITTIVTPILLRHIFRRQLSEDIVVV
ncbi:cation:proton antiporter [Candidatus Bathyarchaeota archaeon]|nr:cation:proton antiporter [Candidatus Bathyarchaeota archaeon]